MREKGVIMDIKEKKLLVKETLLWVIPVVVYVIIMMYVGSICRSKKEGICTHIRQECIINK